VFSVVIASAVLCTNTLWRRDELFAPYTVIWGCSRRRAEVVPFAVGAYITAAYWFTSSTSFANPAVTIARAATDTFAGIRPTDVPAFIVAQGLGAAAATLLFRWLVPTLPKTGQQVTVPASQLRRADAARVLGAGRTE
jgi:glycerol uptake facilitator-like aquaporin